MLTFAIRIRRWMYMCAGSGGNGNRAASRACRYRKPDLCFSRKLLTWSPPAQCMSRGSVVVENLALRRQYTPQSARIGSPSLTQPLPGW